MRRSWLLPLGLGVVLSACGPRPVSLLWPAGAATQGLHQKSSESPTPDDIVALRSDGAVVTVNAHTGGVGSVLATGADAAGGLAENPQMTAVLVTVRNSGTCPAIWALPVGHAPEHPTMIVQDAELPTLSPDGRFLGFVTLGDDCRETGIGIAPVDTSGHLSGSSRRLPLTDLPPALPITGLAVAPGGAAIAVWGGLVDPYLGPHQPTVEVIHPGDAEPWGHAQILFDGQGASVVPLGPGRTVTAPRARYSSPSYAPDGSLLVAGGQEISVYWSTPMSLSIRTLVDATGAVQSIAGGPDGQLAFVDGTGRLDLSPTGGVLPLGGEDMSVSPASFRILAAGYHSVAWTPGPSAIAATPRPVFQPVTMPNLVGVTGAAASRKLASLLLPVLVDRVPSRAARAGIVFAQDPAPGVGMGCQCTVVLKVSSGG